MYNAGELGGLAESENLHLVEALPDEEEEDLAPEDGGNNSDVVPLESVELNTIAGHLSSIGGGDGMMMGPEDYEYLPGWGGGRNGTVAPSSLPQVPEEPNSRTNSAGTDTFAEPRILTVTLKIPCRIVPILLVSNLACALVLQGFAHFHHVRCGAFFAHSKPDASFVNATLPSGCLPPGWHRDYLQEFPPTKAKHDYDAIYWDAYSQQHIDVSHYLSKVQTVSTILLLSSSAALTNICLLAMTRSSTCCCCCRVGRFVPALGLRLRVLSCLALGIWGIVGTLLHLVDIWVHGRVWWLLILITLIASELAQMILYEAYRRDEILPRFAISTDMDQGGGLDAPLLDSEASASRRGVST